ncbi:MAG: 30S ribosomal protein S8 [Candidatus Parvarchaeota archaeon]|nr:30S ribosomal protein S8 [Candidatus Parvarchaeota archaeon]MCW1301988.1 30S ribosomal protein S8 [Candidatus Parvarchaeota archaeon]
MADQVSNALNVIYTSRVSAKKECIITPMSNFILKILDIMNKSGYIDKYEVINDARGGFIKVVINENLNRCKSIRPRLPVKVDEMRKYEERYLPAIGFGILIISTNKGLMTNIEARDEKIGGTLIAYVY